LPATNTFGMLNAIREGRTPMNPPPSSRGASRGALDGLIVWTLPAVTCLLSRATDSGVEPILIERILSESGARPLSKYFLAVPISHAVSCKDEELHKVREQIGKNELI
jgi:hypothetical protein